MGGVRSGFGGALVASLLSLSCASWFSAQLEAPAGARLEEAWRLYSISEDHTAMAIAIDDATGQRVWGMRYGYMSQDSAAKGALDECQENARSRGIAKSCHLLALGNDRAPGAVAASADGRAPESFCTLMNDLVPPN
jgi:hypothetical protein